MIEWREQAACRGQEPRMFFPAHWNTPAIEEAQAFCFECDVRIECLQSALAEEDKGDRWEVAGVRGGLTEEERRRVLSKRRRNRSLRRAS